MANLDRDHYLDKQGLQTLINDLETSIVAEAYSSSATYALGSYCIHDNLLYRCTTAITTAEAWTSGHWTQIVLADDVERKASTVTELADVLLNNPTDNDLLVYDSNLSGGKTWKNAKKIVTCTQAEFDDWLANDTFPYTDCKYIVTDAPNTNGTSEDLSYDGGVTSTHDVIDSMFYHIGDKLYIAGSCYSGRLTGSSTAITVFIPFNKILDSNITGATINGDFTVYGYDGNVQITNSSSTGEWTTLTVLEHGVLGVFTLSSAIALTNGRPINVMFTASGSSSKYVQFS